MTYGCMYYFPHHTCALEQPCFYSYTELPTCPITGLTYILFSKLGYTEMPNERSVSTCTSYSIFELPTNLVREPGQDSQYRDSLRAGRLGVRTQAWARNVLFRTPVQTGPGAHSASCTMGTRPVSRG